MAHWLLLGRMKREGKTIKKNFSEEKDDDSLKKEQRDEEDKEIIREQNKML